MSMPHALRLNPLALSRLHQSDRISLAGSLEAFIEWTGAHYALMVNRQGMTIASAGKFMSGDPQAVAVLIATAAISNRELARTLGNESFSRSLLQGTRLLIATDPVGDDILVSVFPAFLGVAAVRDSLDAHLPLLINALASNKQHGSGLSASVTLKLRQFFSSAFS